MMYKIWRQSFGFFEQETFDDVFTAIGTGIKKGFEFVVIDVDHDNDWVFSWSPIRGSKWHKDVELNK